MNLPTLLLTPLLALALLAAMLFAARLVSGWFEGRRGQRVVESDPDRLALASKRERVLLTLKDLEFEYEMGKLSRGDYDDLRRFYEREAVRVLQELEGA